MFKKLKEFYQQYKPYVRVDLVMYGVLLLLIFLYFVISTLLK
jgi:type II secretory pathway component PulM